MSERGERRNRGGDYLWLQCMSNFQRSCFVVGEEQFFHFIILQRLRRDKEREDSEGLLKRCRVSKNFGVLFCSERVRRATLSSLSSAAEKGKRGERNREKVTEVHV